MFGLCWPCDRQSVSRGFNLKHAGSHGDLHRYKQRRDHFCNTFVNLQADLLQLLRVSDGMWQDKGKCASCSLHLEEHLPIISSATRSSQQRTLWWLSPHKPLIGNSFYQPHRCSHLPFLSNSKTDQLSQQEILMIKIIKLHNTIPCSKPSSKHNKVE